MPTTFFGWIQFLLDKYGVLFLRGRRRHHADCHCGDHGRFYDRSSVAILRTIPVTSQTSPGKRMPLGGVRVFLNAYIEIFRGTPMIVQAMVVYYGALQYLNLDIPALSAAFLVVSINTGAYMAEIVRGGILGVDKGQKEASVAVGLTHWQSMTSVILPQAIRSILPAVGNEFVVNIKDSSVLNVISVTEVYFMSKSAAGTYWKYFEVFFITQ